jgi:hypothetical protein
MRKSLLEINFVGSGCQASQWKTSIPLPKFLPTLIILSVLISFVASYLVPHPGIHVNKLGRVPVRSEEHSKGDF